MAGAFWPSDSPIVPIRFGLHLVPRVYRVHESILARKSDLFESLLNETPDPPLNEPYFIDVVDGDFGPNPLDADLFEIIVSWLYHGRVAITAVVKDVTWQRRETGSNRCQTILARIYLQADYLRMEQLKTDVLSILQEKLTNHAVSFQALELMLQHYPRTQPFISMLATRLLGIVNRQPALLFEIEPHCSWIAELQQYLADHPGIAVMVMDHAFQGVRRAQGLPYDPSFDNNHDPATEIQPVGCCHLNNNNEFNTCCGAWDWVADEDSLVP